MTENTLIDELRLLGWIEESTQPNMPKQTTKKTGKPAIQKKRLTPKDDGYFTDVYKQYLASNHWQERRQRIKPKRCVGCDSTQSLQLHHKVYPPRSAPLQAFIDQPDDQFSWACPSCHQALSRSIRQRRKPKTTRRKSK